MAEPCLLLFFNNQAMPPALQLHTELLFVCLFIYFRPSQHFSVWYVWSCIFLWAFYLAAGTPLGIRLIVTQPPEAKPSLEARPCHLLNASCWFPPRVWQNSASESVRMPAFSTPLLELLNTTTFKKERSCCPKMAHWLWALAALVEDESWVPSTHTVAHNHL